MKTNTHITCDYCSEQVLLPRENSILLNSLHGWVTIQDLDGEKNFCSPLCKHRYEYDIKHPDNPHVKCSCKYRFSRFLKWPIAPRS